MTRVLVIQGAGLNMRGKAQLEIFGPSTLEQINEQVRGFADSLGVDVEIFHSNLEGEVANALYDAHERDVDAALINPGGYSTTTGIIPAAINQVRYPVIEVHVSNPASRGSVSTIAPACKGTVTGFGVHSYYFALEAVKHLVEG